MKKIVVLLIVVSVLLTGCFGKGKEKEVDLAPNEQVIKLLPNEGFKWSYNGFVDYRHEMELISITTNENRVLYKITGEVEDASGGESNSDYTLDIYYIIQGDALIQKKEAPMMMDSDFDELTIIKAPLEVGTKWEEEIVDKDGNKRTIVGKIMDIAGEEDKIYKISYNEPESDYYETREIAEGFGIISFTRSMIFDGESYSIGYGLYGDGSGYYANSNKENDQADSNDTEAPATETDDSEAGEENGENTEAETPVDHKILVEEVSAVIYDFNSAWIDYVNNNNKSFFDYVVPNGVADRNGKNFVKSGLTEEFLKIDIRDVSISENMESATLVVYEKIEKVKSGKTSVVEYLWKYKLVKKDDRWLVDGYVKAD